MERSQLFDLMGELKLYGMKAAFDEIMATAVKRQHEPQRIVGDLLNAEISEKQARSIKYQLTIAKLPLAKDLDDFQFEGTPINETLVRDLASGDFIAQQRNAVLVGGTGTGKTHLAMAGVNMQHVPYRGSAPMLTDLLAGQVQVAFDNLQPSIPHIKAGKLRALAVSTYLRAQGYGVNEPNEHDLNKVTLTSSKIPYQAM